MGLVRGCASSHWTRPGSANDSPRMLPLATRTAARVTRVRMPLPIFLHALLVIVLAMDGAAAHALGVAVEVTPAGELFPALELSQSGVDSGSGLLRIRLTGASPPQRVRVRIDTPGLLEPTVIDTEVGSERVLRPRLEWDVGALRGLDGTRRQSLDVVVEREGAAPIHRSVEVRVHALDEALYFVRDGDARIDLGFMFAAWVDPQSPVVDDVLALARDVDPRMPTTARSDDERLAQVRAVWMALERRGLRYADEGAGISQGPVIYSQRVRLLADSWDERVANCLDGSVLIASALERLGIRTMLVLVPGHAFVGFYADDGNRHAEFLETTLLGRRPGGMALKSGIDAARAETSFGAALAAGGERYRRASTRLDGRHRPNYAVIDISTARSYGIMPLAVDRVGSGSSMAAPSATSSFAQD